MSRHVDRRRVDDDSALLLLHGYLLERKTVGEGSYAVVKSAVHKTFGSVAIKIVDKANNAPKEFVNKFFPRELDILKKLNHQNIVRVHEIFEIGRKTFIVMELADKGDLLEYIKPKKFLPEHQAKFFFRQLVEACRYLHAKNIIHRDLKCENILLDGYYNIKVTDFGFSRILRPDESSRTFCGSAAYAAPEILRGEPYSGFAYDMWSLGVILYIMICGKMPFDDDDTRKQQAEQMARSIQYPSRLKLSVDAKSLISKLLEPDIPLRYDCESILTSKWMKKMPYIFLCSSEESKHVLDGNLSKLVRQDPPRANDSDSDSGHHAKNTIAIKFNRLTSILRGSDKRKREKDYQSKKKDDSPAAHVATI